MFSLQGLCETVLDLFDQIFGFIAGLLSLEWTELSDVCTQVFAGV